MSVRKPSELVLDLVPSNKVVIEINLIVNEDQLLPILYTNTTWRENLRPDPNTFLINELCQRRQLLTDGQDLRN